MKSVVWTLGPCNEGREGNTRIMYVSPSSWAAAMVAGSFRSFSSKCPLTHFRPAFSTFLLNARGALAAGVIIQPTELSRGQARKREAARGFRAGGKDREDHGNHRRADRFGDGDCAFSRLNTLANPGGDDRSDSQPHQFGRGRQDSNGATVKDSKGNALGKKASWSSSNPGVAEVEVDGNLTAKSPRETTVVASMGFIKGVCWLMYRT